MLAYRKPTAGFKLAFEMKPKNYRYASSLYITSALECVKTIFESKLDVGTYYPFNYEHPQRAYPDYPQASKVYEYRHARLEDLEEWPEIAAVLHFHHTIHRVLMSADSYPECESVLRMLHYPPQTKVNGGTHKDFDYITTIAGSLACSAGGELAYTWPKTFYGEVAEIEGKHAAMPHAGETFTDRHRYAIVVFSAPPLSYRLKNGQTFEEYYAHKSSLTHA